MTDLSKSQLNAILSALDGPSRNPNSKDAALRATAVTPSASASASTTCSPPLPVCSTAG